jgi:RimJ/RimL family protein N-acetyltransferase
MKETRIHSSSQVTKNIRLRLVVKQDAPFVVALRSDIDKARYLSRSQCSVEAQEAWIEAYKSREADGDEYYFVIEALDGESLGVVRMYDFIGDSFCWGSWIIKSEAPLCTGIESALSIYEIAFYQLGFLRVHFDVRKENERVVRFHTRFGAEIVNETELDYYFQYDKEMYEAVRSKYAKYLLPQ